MNAVGVKGLTGEFLLTPHHEQTKPIIATQVLYRFFRCFQRAITKLIMIYVPGASLRGTRQSDVEPEAPWHLARRSLNGRYHLATESKQIQRFSRALKQGVDRPAAGEKIH